MKSNPDISVIITTYNRPESLTRAIRSVLLQDFKNFEVIVVDDGSAEETGKAVRDLNDQRIVYVRNPKNLGGTKSLNVGLKEARGEYVCPLDDDDTWSDREKLSKQWTFLEGHPEYVLLGTNVVVVEGKSRKEITRSSWPEDDAALRKIIFHENPFAHSSVMYRRKSAISVKGYDETLPRGKDYDLILKLGMVGRFAVLGAHGVEYCETPREGVDLMRMRLEDAKATAGLVWRHRREYPGPYCASSVLLARIMAFWILARTPFLARLYRHSYKCNNYQ